VSPSLPSGIRHVDGSALAGRSGGLLELALDPERIASGLALEGLRRDRTGAWWRGMEVELGRDAAGTVTVSGYGSDALRRRAGVVTGDERSSWFVEPLDDPSELVSSWTTTDTVLAGTMHVAGGIVHRGGELRRLRSFEPHGSLSAGDATSIAFEGEDGDEVVVASGDRLGWIQKGGLVDGLPVMVWAERDGRSGSRRAAWSTVCPSWSGPNGTAGRGSWATGLLEMPGGQPRGSRTRPIAGPGRSEGGGATLLESRSSSRRSAPGRARCRPSCCTARTAGLSGTNCTSPVCRSDLTQPFLWTRPGA
jgi:hypothetical protein